MNPQLLLAYGSPVAAAFPRRWAAACARAAGDIGAALLPHARAVVDANLQQALGAPAPAALRRQVFRSYALYYLEAMRLAQRAPEAAVGAVRLHGEEALAATLARGRGALVLGAHLGNWDVAGAALVRRFGALTTFAEPLRPERLQRFYNGMRQRHGMRVVPLGSRTRLPWAVLRDNGILGLLVDRTYDGRQLAVPFGCGELLVPTAGIRVALQAGAGIHAFFPLRREDGFVVEIGADLAAPAAGAVAAPEVRAVAAAFAAALLAVVRRHPEQWCLLQPVGALPPTERRQERRPMALAGESR